MAAYPRHGCRHAASRAAKAWRVLAMLSRNSDGNPDSPQVVVFLATIVDVIVGY